MDVCLEDGFARECFPSSEYVVEICFALASNIRKYGGIVGSYLLFDMFCVDLFVFCVYCYMGLFKL